MLWKPICLTLLLMFSPSFAVAKDSAGTLAKAEQLIAQGDNDAAVITLQKLVTHSPEDFHAWFVLGMTQAKLQHLDDAIISFNKVIQLQPTLAEPHNNLAVIFNLKGDLRAAVKQLEASLDLNPDYVVAHENIGDLYVKLAAQSYKKALANGESGDLRARYERLLYLRGDDSESAAPITTQQPTEAVAPPKAESVQQQITAAIKVWQKAWSNKDVDGYFNAYAKDFDPGEKFATVSDWRRYKRWAISKKRYIKISIDGLKIKPLTENLVKATFNQHFRSNNYSSDDRKEVVFKRTANGWKLINEAAK